MLAALGLNFLVVPVVVFGLTRFLPQEPVILVGAFMVLLMPCLERLNAEFYYLTRDTVITDKPSGMLFS